MQYKYCYGNLKHLVFLSRFMTIDMPVKSYSTHPGSPIGIMIKVESENDIVDTSCSEYYLQIYSKDRDLIESWLESEAVAKYVKWTLIPHDIHQLSEE